MHKSVDFEAMVKAWSREINGKKEVDTASQTNGRSVRSKVSSCSSKLSTLSKKRDTLAYAQLRVEQDTQHEILTAGHCLSDSLGRHHPPCKIYINNSTENNT